MLNIGSDDSKFRAFWRVEQGTTVWRAARQGAPERAADSCAPAVKKHQELVGKQTNIVRSLPGSMEETLTPT